MSTQEMAASIGMEPKDLFELLNARRRRLAIVELARIGRPVGVSDLSREIAVRHDIEEGTTSPRKRIHIGLLQHHLKHLERSGLVSVDRTNTITPHPDTRTVADIIEAVDMVCTGEAEEAAR